MFNLGSTSHDKGTPSLGMDRNGYLHLAAGMHNGGWEYYVSKAPRDISGFETHGWDSSAKILGERISYPSFVTDRQGTLFATYRTRADPLAPLMDGNDLVILRHVVDITQRVAHSNHRGLRGNRFRRGRIVVDAATADLDR